MAKKVLTPEQAEIKAMKKAKSSQNWTKFWAIVLAAALTLGVVALGKNQAQTAIDEAVANSGAVQQDGQVNNGGVVNNDGTGDNSGAVNNDGTGDNSGTTDNSGTSNSGTSNSGTSNSGTSNSGTSNSGTSNSGATAQDEKKANVAKLLNEVTAKVANGSYDWTRKCYYTQPLDVGDATSTLNTVIGWVDKDADLGSVVGGFLGITGTKDEDPWSATVTKGAFPADRNLPEKYLMKGFNLTASDIASCDEKNGTYTIMLNNCNRPQKDGKNPLHHVTNDFITQTEVSTEISNALGTMASLARLTIQDIDVDFTNIKIVAKVEGNALKQVDISYTMTVKKLSLTALGSEIVGTGAGNLECSYFNFS